MCIRDRVGGVKIGKNCMICSSLLTKEPYLIEIGNNTTVSTNVSFVTHDNSAKLIFGAQGDLFGRIVVGDNCFIGANTTILYGVELADNIIVAAGSVEMCIRDRSGAGSLPRGRREPVREKHHLPDTQILDGP